MSSPQPPDRAASPPPDAGSEALNAAIVRSAVHYAVFTTDLDGRITSWNPGARSLMGWEPEQIIGQPAHVTFVPEDVRRGAVEHERRTALEQGRALNERWHLRRDGTRFFGSGLMMPLREADGRIVGLLKIMRDRTAQLRVEPSHEDGAGRLGELMRLKALADAARSVVLASSLMDALQALAESARRIVGAHQGVVSLSQGADWRQAINAVSLSEKYEHWRRYDAQPDGSGIYARVCRTNEPARMTQAELEADPHWRGFGRHAADHPPMRGWLAVPLTGSDSRNLGLIQLSDKIEGEFDEADEAIVLQLAQLASAAVEQTQANEARRRTEQELREADRRKDEFLAMLAHELRNPLAPLTNVLRLLERGTSLDERERELLAMAERQTRQLRRLVDDLLEVSRITRGKIELRPEPMMVATAVYNAAESVAAAVEERGQVLQIALPGQTSRIVADPARIAQVLENLLNNASKYTQPGGTLRVEVDDRPGEVEIRVIDNGIGIDPDHLPRLFQLFAQVDATFDRSQGGLGIGLALVRRLVELHGGSVAVASAGKGLGSTFTVRLPRGGTGERAAT